MNICLAAYGNRIASLLETSDRLILIHAPDFDKSSVQTIPLYSGAYNEILKILQENNVNTLICGAITACVHDLLRAQNIEIIPWITGNVSDIIDALNTQKVLSPKFNMPGRGKGFRFRHGLTRRNKFK
jgi:predicted Fe-Mo cluster-binding NifX family protein